MRPIHLNIHTWGSGEQEKPRNSTRSGFSSPLPRLPAPLLEAQTLSWKRYRRQRAPRPALSRLCGGQKKRGFIAPNIGPLCAAFLALCRGTASVYMAALNRAGTLHSSERPLCKCQRDTLSSRRRLPPLSGTSCVTGKPGISCPSAPGTHPRGPGGNGETAMAPESEVGWGPLWRSSESLAKCKISAP